MKKITLLIAISFAFQFNAMSQVLIPDVNFEQRLINDGIDSNPVLDGQISTVDALAVVLTLNLGSSNITDFTGIEGFTNMTALNVEYNGLATGTLDVSNSSGLTFLKIEGCFSLTGVNTAGLTGLLEIQGAGAGLNALDVSTNTALQILSINSNNVAILDLSLNTDLVVMSAKSNGLTDLDMRNGNNDNVTFFDSDSNSGLTCIFVDDASSPYLTTLWSYDALSTYVNNEAECNTLSIDTEIQNVFNVFPNPVNNNTLFVNVNAQDSQLSIYDLTGKLVLSKSLNLGENTIDVGHISSGVYLARFAVDGLEQTKKLIIQ